MAHISSILTYPLKSTRGISHLAAEITPWGFLHDRSLALFDREGNCLTGREYPQLLDVTCDISTSSIDIHLGGNLQVSFEIPEVEDFDELKIFSYDAYGSRLSSEADTWFSNYLGIECRLYKSSTQGGRPVLSKHGGDESSDRVAFADQAPILILGEASLDLLNSKLDRPIGMERFRPNLVISDIEAHEEDRWKLIEIDDVQFKIIQPCERCVFVTIDNTTKLKDPNGEPLRTLATYRKGTKGVIFGMHAVPLSSGIINIEAVINVLS